MYVPSKLCKITVSAQSCIGKFEVSLVLLNFWVVILLGGLKLPKLLIHTLIMFQK